MLRVQVSSAVVKGPLGFKFDCLHVIVMCAICACLRFFLSYVNVCHVRMRVFAILFQLR